MDWSSLAAMATAIGVILGVWQLRQSANLSKAEYEDSFDQQYRALAMAIPVDALIGREIPAERKDEVRELVYNYLDLCNEQIFQRSKKKISKDTWSDWCDGMREHLERPAFMEVWNEIKREAPGTFTFLEALENSGWVDPARPRYRNRARQSSSGRSGRKDLAASSDSNPTT